MLSTIAAIALWVGTAVVGVPLLFWSVEVVLGVIRRHGLKADDGKPDNRPVVAVLIPAHNEQAVIGRTLGALMPQLGEGDRVLVVADNCTDETSEVAASFGAEVSERTDSERRGKGYALDYGLGLMRAWEEPPGVVVIFDADCVFDGAGQLAALARESAMTGTPVQSRYLLRPPADATVGDRISAFAIAVKNIVRPLGLGLLGGPCLITGSGIAIPWGLVEKVDLASGDIVEDMRLGVDLALAGSPPRVSASALVLSVLPSSDAGRASQRTRWEQGHLRSIAAHVPRLLAGSVRRPSLLLLAMELAVPPFSLLVMLSALWFGVVAAAGLLSLASGWILGLNAGLALLAVIAVGLAWVRVGRDVLPIGSAVMIPVWVLRKIGVYAGLARGGERNWVRTERTPADAAGAATPEAGGTPVARAGEGNG